MLVFLKYGTVTGEVKEPAHRGWIDLRSAQIDGKALTSPHAKGGVDPREIILTREQDSASPALQRESLSGEGVFAALDFLRGDCSVYLRIETTGTLISRYSISGKGSRSPVESLTLKFEKLEWKDTPGTPPP